ncbi:MAG: DUF86 domain-containing protein [Haloarculaceae archaeon]
MSDELADDQLQRILTAVDTIEACLGRLVEARETVDRETVQQSSDTQDIVARRFVMMTEATLDIGTVLVVHERGTPPPSNPATMRILGDLEILPDSVASKMVDAARFRNVLAHTYGGAIDHDIVYDALEDLERYREFVLAVRDYLNKTDSLD